MMLTIEGVSVQFGGIAALKNVGFSVDEGQVISLIGPNGAGKTTLFNIVSGFTRSDTGRIKFGDVDITHGKPNQIARLGLVRTFQKTEVFPEISVFECVRIGLLNRIACAGILQTYFCQGKVARIVSNAPALVEDLLEQVGLLSKWHTQANALSYGEQRLLEIAVALAASPRLLLLDEPASGLNPEECRHLSDQLKRLKRAGITVILVEHNMTVVMSVSDKVVVLHHGEMIFEGTPREVSSSPSVISAYLGREWLDNAAS
jgi:branched-chain amino acid transport system ATP-binding protein